MAFKQRATIMNARGDVLRVRIWTDRGQVVDFVVQYEALIEGEYRPVVRYDVSSHDRPHRDRLRWDGGKLDTTPLPPGTTVKQALDWAIADIKTRWEQHLDAFMRRRL